MGRGQSPPMFPGLMPTSGRVTIPRGFSPPQEERSPSNDSEDIDFDVSTAKALQEWEQIRQAFDLFRARLGPDFEPLGPEFARPDMTPFGPALTYRTYSIAGIWMNYYMGLIVLHRAHPSMPPVAVIAAGMAAQQTGRWAAEVARIAAGLHEDTTHVAAISTLVGSAFIESCFPLFVAGVQVRIKPSSLLPPLKPINAAPSLFLNVLKPPRTDPGPPAAALADPPAARHCAADGVAVGAADRRGVRVRVEQGGGAGARPPLLQPARARPLVPGLGVEPAAAHRPAHPGARGAAGREPAGAGQERADALCAGAAERGAGSGRVGDRWG